MRKPEIPTGYRPRVSVRKRKDRGLFFMDYDLPPQHGEERVRQRIAIPAKNRKEAEFLRVKKQEALWQGRFEDADYKKMNIESPPSEHEMTFHEFIPEFYELRERGGKRPLSARYKDTQEKVIEKVLMPYFGSMALSEIDADVIDNFITHLQEEEHPQARLKDENGIGRLAPHTINNYIGVLGKILTVAFRRNRISSRPIIEKLPLPIKENEEDILSPEEVIKLFSACEGVTGRMIKAYVLTGCRAMELAALRWEDYTPKWTTDENGYPIGRLDIRHQIQPYVMRNKADTKEQAFKLIPPKCNSVRWIPVGEELAAILNEQAALTRLQDGFIFLTENGKPFCNELIRKALQRTCRRANVRVVSPQTLRRTFATQLQEADVHPNKVAKLTGHRSLAVLQRNYTRVADRTLVSLGTRLEDFLLGPKEKKQSKDGHQG